MKRHAFKTVFPVLTMVLRSRKFLFFVLPNLVFLALALCTLSTTLIPLFSMVIVALSVGICVSFMPSVFSFFNRKGEVKRSEALALGIWLTWFATALIGVWSFTWRAMGQPLWLVNNDAVSYFRFISIMGACYHLASPGAITESIPPAKWVKVGIISAVGCFSFFIIAFLLHYFGDFPI